MPATTLVIGDQTFKLALLPSGIVRPGKLSVIGNGVVVDLVHLLKEIEAIKTQGVAVTPDNLAIAENVTLILSLHRELDAHRESAMGTGTQIGTTKRGIGPAYEDKVGRRAIRLSDLAEPATLDDKIGRLLAPSRAAPSRARPRTGERRDHAATSSWPSPPPSSPTCARPGSGSRRLRRDGKRILFEGAQGALLDIDHGTYPFVTSSRTRSPRTPRPAPASARRRWATSSGSPKPIRRGSVAAPFRPSCMTRSASASATAATNTRDTGRRRRCGWFDAVLVRQTVKTSGIDGIALTKLDILDGFDSIEVCTHYELDGRRIDRLPASQAAQARVTPVYETIEGWHDTTAGALVGGPYPAQAIKYVRRIEELIEAPVALLSTSPEREDTILVHNPFRD